MKKTPESETRRAYQSELRADQALATRERILDAVVGRLASGDRTISYARLAREARVSVPTVYRHFPTRQDLFDAIFARTELEPVAAAPADADIERGVRAFFARTDDPDGIYAKAARLNTVWEFSRATTVPRRLAWFSACIDQRLPGLPEPQRSLLLDICVVSFSSATAEAYRGYLDRSGAQTAERVLFALDALFAHAATFLPPEAP